MGVALALRLQRYRLKPDFYKYSLIFRFIVIFHYLFATNGVNKRNKMKTHTKEQKFTDIILQHKNIIYKVCYIYAPKGMIEDYYQEVLCNLWQSFDSFDGRSKRSTWIYRVAY